MSTINTTISLLHIDGVLTDLYNSLSDENRLNINDDIGSELSSFVMDWYRKAGNEYFNNPSSLTHGPGRRNTNWARGTTENWSHKDVTLDNVTVFFNGDDGFKAQFAMKVYGGVITAKNKKALTIPIHPTAHATRATEYQNITGNDLFRPKGKSYLAAKINGEFTPVYLLRKSVNIDPHPQALPTESELENAASMAMEDAIEDMLD